MGKRKEKLCKIHIVIHLRDKEETERTTFCVNAKCETHKQEWFGLTDDPETAMRTATSFPLVYGGLGFTESGFSIKTDCICANIPTKGEQLK